MGDWEMGKGEPGHPNHPAGRWEHGRMGDGKGLPRPHPTGEKDRTGTIFLWRHSLDGDTPPFNNVQEHIMAVEHRHPNQWATFSGKHENISLLSAPSEVHPYCSA